MSRLWFILYIKEIVYVPEHSEISLFADDTLVWAISDNLSDTAAKINADLERIDKYMGSQRLRFNTKKTKYMVIGGSNGLPKSRVKIEEDGFQEVTSMKYLDVLHLECGICGKEIGIPKLF